MPVKTSLYNQTGEKVKDMNLSEKVFNVELNEDLLHQALVTQQGKERQVVAHTKGRSEVRGGGRKPWRQKGTGRARAGTIRSPLWIGGGVTFGPGKERNYKKKINQKMKQKALWMTLTDKVKNSNLVIIDKIDLGEAKTKLMDKFLKTVEEKILKNKDKKRSFLLIGAEKEENLWLAGRNLPNLKIINVNNINIVDLLRYRDLIFTKEAVAKLEKTYK